jgi:hypothetical protein
VQNNSWKYYRPAMSVQQTSIDDLPEEIVLQIFSFIDSRPPSETQIRLEPSLKFTSRTDHVLKDLSVISKQWRRLIIPSLFRHAHLRLDGPPLPHWQDCTVCWDFARRQSGLRPATGKSRSSEASVGYHATMYQHANNWLTAVEDPVNSHWADDVVAQGAGAAGPAMSPREIFSWWAPRFYHHLHDFLTFLHQHELTAKVQSFTLTTDEMLPSKLDRYPHRAGTDRDLRYACAAAFWAHLLSVLDLQRIVVAASPADLACLTNSAIDTFGAFRCRFTCIATADNVRGDWAFGDMSYHILEMRLEGGAASPLLGKPVLYSELDHVPRRYPGIAGSSVLNLRPWSAVTINEGAFLKAYGTYEYFERGPPTLLYSIKDCLTPRPTYSTSLERVSDVPLASLKKLTYIGIFPFANHLDFRELLPQLEELDLQLAPVVGSHILDDPGRVGKADLQDCWSELLIVYQDLVGQLATFRISERTVPHLKRVICRDIEWKALREELDEIFVPLCMPVWCEQSLGRYLRLKGSADVDGAEAVVDW